MDPALRERLVLGQGGDAGGRFAHAETLLQHDAGLVVLLDQADRQGRPAAHDHPHAAKGFGLEIRACWIRNRKMAGTPKKR